MHASVFAMAHHAMDPREFQQVLLNGLHEQPPDLNLWWNLYVLDQNAGRQDLAGKVLARMLVLAPRNPTLLAEQRK